MALAMLPPPMKAMAGKGAVGKAAWGAAEVAGMAVGVVKNKGGHRNDRAGLAQFEKAFLLNKPNGVSKVPASMAVPAPLAPTPTLRQQGRG